MRRCIKNIYKSFCSRPALLGACVFAVGCLVLFLVPARGGIAMADLPLWGSMQKAQDDAETSEQAIARLVGVHNDATDAHLGSTRSLEAHKAEDVIDHPVASVVPDKFDTDFFDVTFDFRSLTGLSQTGNIENIYWPGMTLQAGGSAGGIS